MSPYDKLAALGIELPPLVPPVAAFVPYVRTGNLLFVSGHVAKRDGRPWTGQLGTTLTTAEGQQAARAAAIDLLAALHDATGDLARVRRIVKLLVLVQSAPTFTEAHLVANGASELLGEVLGEAGRHARAAIGVVQTPMGSCLEIEMIAELADLKSARL